MRRTICLVLTVALAVMAAGCSVSEERIKKAEGFYTEGLAHMNTDRQRAFVNFQKAVGENPKHKQAHYNLAHLYMLQGKPKEAEQELKDALRIDSDYSEAHNYLGNLLAMRGQSREAIAHYRAALTNPLYETPDVALYGLGQALEQEGDMQAAADAFEDALNVSPSTVPPAKLHLALGRAYYRLGNDTKARDSLLRVTGLDKGGEDAAMAGQLLERLTP